MFQPLLGKEWLNAFWPDWKERMIGKVGQIVTEEKSNTDLLSK